MNNKNIAKIYFEEIWNKRNYSLANKIISDQLETRFPTSHGNGAQGLLRVIESRYEAFPDLHFEIIDMVSEGRKIWILYRFTGTHKGEFWGIKPTNKKVDMHGCLMLEIMGGKVTKGKSIRDELGLLEQVGFVSIPNKNDRQ